MAQQMCFESVGGFSPDRLGQTEFTVPALGVLDDLGTEQTEKWTVEWEFQMRITDALGTPIASAKR